MKFQTLQPINSKEDFVTFWKLRYRYESEIDYANTINSEINHIMLKELFIWKNGRRMSSKKEISFKNKIQRRVELLRTYRKSSKRSIRNLYDELSDVSFVWRVFACHIARPSEYPIYDQHIHRAVLYLLEDESWRGVNNTMSMEQKELFYFEVYLSYFLPQFKEFSYRDIDKALFAFGRYLKDYELSS